MDAPGFRLHLPGGPLPVRSFRGREVLGRPFQFRIQAGPGPEPAFLAPATLASQDGAFQVQGLLGGVDRNAEGRLDLLLVPMLWPLSLRTDPIAFPPLPLPGILASLATGPACFLMKEGPVLEGVTLLGETHLDFLTRWCEREGVPPVFLEDGTARFQEGPGAWPEAGGFLPGRRAWSLGRAARLQGRGPARGLWAGRILGEEGEWRFCEAFHAFDPRRGYRNILGAEPAGLPWRPFRPTPRPRVEGVVLARTGPGIPCRDRDGRLLHAVRMPFPPHPLRSLPLLQPWGGGEGHGHLPLPAGTEVLLAFLEGDPDRPVIVAVPPGGSPPALLASPGDHRLSLEAGGLALSRPGASLRLGSGEDGGQDMEVATRGGIRSQAGNRLEVAAVRTEATLLTRSRLDLGPRLEGAGILARLCPASTRIAGTGDFQLTGGLHLRQGGLGIQGRQVSWSAHGALPVPDPLPFDVLRQALHALASALAGHSGVEGPIRVLGHVLGALLEGAGILSLRFLAGKRPPLPAAALSLRGEPGTAELMAAREDPRDRASLRLASGDTVLAVGDPLELSMSLAARGDLPHLHMVCGGAELTGSRQAGGAAVILQAKDPVPEAGISRHRVLVALEPPGPEGGAPRALLAAESALEDLGVRETVLDLREERILWKSLAGRRQARIEADLEGGMELVSDGGRFLLARNLNLRHSGDIEGGILAARRHILIA